MHPTQWYDTNQIRDKRVGNHLRLSKKLLTVFFGVSALLIITNYFPFYAYAEIENFVESTLEEKLLMKITASDFAFRGGAINESTALGYFKGLDLQNGDWFLVVVDLSENKFEIVTTIPLKAEPNNILIDESNNKIYLVSSYLAKADVIDGHSNEITNFLEFGNLPFGASSVKLNENTGQMYVFTGSWPSGTHFDVYDLKTAKKINSFPIKFRQGMGYGGFFINEEKNLIYLYKYFPHQILVFDEKGNRVDLIEFSEIEHISSVAFNEDENKIYMIGAELIKAELGKYESVGRVKYVSKLMIIDMSSKEKSVIDWSEHKEFFMYGIMMIDNPEKQLILKRNDHIAIYDLKNNTIQKIIARDISWGLVLNEANGQIYLPYGNELRVLSFNASFEKPSEVKEISVSIISYPDQPSCGKGTHLENGQCVLDKKTAVNYPKIGLVKGQWVKYQLSNFDVNSNVPFMSSEALQQAFLESIIPVDDVGSYLNTKWLKLRIDNISGSKVTMITSVGLSDGGEKDVVTQTLDVNDAMLVIPTNMKIGDKITWEDNEFIVKDEVQMTIGGKQVDALRLVSEQVLSDLGVISEVRLENFYHKQTGMLLMINNEGHVRGGGQSIDFIIALNAVEVSDHFLERASPSLVGGGCLIATATFGTELAPQVQLLREIRDNKVLKTESGFAFMAWFNDFYYSFSPTVADWERQNPIFKEAVKVVITPMITSLSILNYVDVDSEEGVLRYGIGIILLNVGIYFIGPSALILKIRKIFQNSPKIS